MKGLIAAIIVLGCAWALASAFITWVAEGAFPNTPPRFTEDDIDRVKRSIRAEWESKKDVTHVGDIVLIRKSDEEATGYVDLTIGTTPVRKSCEAWMTSEPSRYLLSCR